jgi:hypothetical protein
VPILLGVALSGDQGVAIVAESVGSQSLVVTINDQVNGWRVVAIGRDSVTFRSKSSDAVAHLKTPDGEPPASSHPPATPPRRARTEAISISANPSPAECWALSHRPPQPFTEMDGVPYATAMAMLGACNLQRVARR